MLYSLLQIPDFFVFIFIFVLLLPIIYAIIFIVCIIWINTKLWNIRHWIYKKNELLEEQNNILFSYFDYKIKNINKNNFKNHKISWI